MGVSQGQDCTQFPNRFDLMALLNGDHADVGQQVTCHRSFTQPRLEPAATLIRSPTLDRPKAEFSGFAQGDGLVAPPDFVSMIGTLLPIAPCGRSSL